MGFARRCALALVRWFGFVVALTFATQPAYGLGPNEVPAPLRPWIRWALESEPSCPQVGEQATCVWPGLLELDLDGEGGRFRLRVTVDGRNPVRLPGSDTLWPQDVLVPGELSAVLPRDGVPTIWLTEGTHEVRGRFVWNELPETLPIPREIALTTLRIEGKLVGTARRDESRIWLRSSGAPSQEEESLSLEVFRHIADEVPLRVTTRLLLRASGKVREVHLGQVALPGARPLRLEAELPVRFEAGTLFAQVSPGTHQISLEALHPVPPRELQRPAREQSKELPSFWPEQEIWVFSPDSKHRQVTLSGSLGVDPQQTNLPQEWKHLSAYVVLDGQGLVLQEERRGEPEPPPNRLILSREMWLDLDGNAYTVRDTFSGNVHRDWRLDLIADGELGHVAVDGRDQLITKNPKTGAPGVELRGGTLNMTAEWRTKGGVRTLPAVGWSEDVQELRTNVHVPPGWRVLSERGVDTISETWLSNWNLFALFFVLIVALATAKLTHPVWGGLALLTLVLIHDEAEAPQMVWLFLLGGIALFRVVPQGWFRRVVFVVTSIAAAVLIVGVVGFGAGQLSAALYPQASHGADEYWFPSSWTGTLSEPQIASESLDNQEGGTGTRAKGQRYAVSGPSDSAQKDNAPVQKQAVLIQQDPEALIQTGPGVPEWNWHQWSLGWSGPVHRDHTVRLYLLAPFGSSVIAALRAVLTGLFAWLLLRFALVSYRRPPASGSPAARTSAAALLLFSLGAFAGALLFTSHSGAQIPDREMLNELETRLRPKPQCQPNCVSVSSLRIDVQGTELTLTAAVHAGDVVSYQLPGPASNWVPRTVTVNGSRSTSLVLGADGFLHLRLPPGTHRVELRGPLGTELTLTPGTPPHFVEVNARDWLVEGVSDQGQVEGSVELRRQGDIDAEEGEQDVRAAGAVELPSWVRVTRTVRLGVNWSVETELHRVSPANSPTVVRVPLLPGEKLTSQGIAQVGSEAVVTLERGVENARFESLLSQAEALELVASEGRGFSERWVIQCSPMWRCALQGVPPVTHTNEGLWEPHYHPFPGEKLTLTIQKLVPESGRHVTVDSAKLALSPGARLLHAELQVQLRTSTQRALSIELPAQAEVQELLVDGQPQPMRKVDHSLQVGTGPGAHHIKVSWQQAGGMATRFVTPRVALDAEIVNAEITVRVPDDRWLLFAGGPRWGPAVLLWGYLLLIVLVSFVLGRIPKSPLKTWQWILLGLGLTQVPVVVLCLIAAWFFLFAHIGDHRPKHPLLYNLSQFVLACATLVFLGCLLGSVYDGLLSSPDMEVVGAGSSERSLRWYVDRVDGTFPTAWVWSTSLWAWRVSMLAWALWLSWNLLRWLKWAWQVFAEGGLSKPLNPNKPPPPAGSASQGSKAPDDPVVSPAAQSASSVPQGTAAVSPASADAATANPVEPTPLTSARLETEPHFDASWVTERTPIEPVLTMSAQKRELRAAEPSVVDQEDESRSADSESSLPSPEAPSGKEGELEERPTVPMALDEKDLEAMQQQLSLRPLTTPSRPPPRQPDPAHSSGSEVRDTLPQAETAPEKDRITPRGLIAADDPRRLTETAEPPEPTPSNSESPEPAGEPEPAPQPAESESESGPAGLDATNADRGS